MIYAVLWLYGLPIGDTTPANFVPVNMADDWLDLVLAAGMIGLGVLLGRDRRARAKPRSADEPRRAAACE